MNILKKIIAIIMLMTVIISAVSCGNGGAENSTGAGESAQASKLANQTENNSESVWNSFWDTVEEAEKSALEAVWSDRELNGSGSIFYPGFELGALRKKSGGAAIPMLRRGELCVAEVSDTCLIVANGNRTVRIDGVVSLFDRGLFGGQYAVDEGARVFLHDLTGDGREDLVIKMSFLDNGYRYNTVHVFDTDTMERLGLPSEAEFKEILGGFLENNFVMEKDGEGNVRYRITDSCGNTKEGEYLPDDDSAVSLKARISDLSYTYVRNGELYYKNEVWLVDGDSVSPLISCLKKVCDIEVKLEYNAEQKCFEAVENNIMLNN